MFIIFGHFFWTLIFYNIFNVLSFESDIALSGFGKEYSRIDIDATLLDNQIANSLIQCASQCSQYFQCQIFNYDKKTKKCQLFEGDITTTGSIIPSSSATSIVGCIQFSQSNFKDYNQPCDQCTDNRFLRCINNQCQCQEHTYWNGTFCLAQIPATGMNCKPNMSMCRTDLGLTCGSYNKCIENTIVVTFDDLLPFTAVSNGYHNINWVNAYVHTITTSPSGYCTGIVSKNNTSYNNNANPVTITSANGCPITLNSLSVAAAWYDNLQLTIVGYNSNVVIQNKTYTIQVFTLSNLTFNGYEGLDKIVFSTSGGTKNPYVSSSGTHYAMDNIDLTFT